MKFPSLSIKVKLLTILLLFGLTPFLVISFFNIQTVREETQKEEMTDKLLLFVDAKAKELLSYFNFIEVRALDFASDGFIQESFFRLTQTLSLEAQQSLNRHLVYNKKPLDDSLISILLMDLKGEVLASTEGEFIDHNLSADYWERALKGPFITEMGPHPFNQGKDAFLAAAPIIHRERREPIGVLIAIFEAKPLQILLADRLGFAEKGRSLFERHYLQTLQVYAVNKEGLMVIPPLDFNQPETAPFPSPIRVDTPPVKSCLEEGRSIGGMVYPNYKNEEVIGVSVCFPGKEWVVLAEIKTDEAFLGVHWMAIRFALLVSFFFLTVLLSALVLSRKVTEPLKAMMEVVYRVREGDLDAQIPVKTNDEIGQLARALNETTARLKKSYGFLERKVRQKTQALHEKVIKVEQAKAKNEAILESIADGIIAIDSEGKIVLVNQPAQELLRWELSRVRGKRGNALLVLEDEEGHEITIAKHPFNLALFKGIKVQGVYYISAVSRSRFPIAVHVSPVLLNQKSMGAIMIFRDVSREKEIERMKNEFVSLVSHQLRTPLSAMKWFSEMLISGDVGHLNRDQREFIGNISQLNEQMIDLVTALLNIARIESGRIIIEPAPTRLEDLVHEVLTNFQEKVAAKKLDFVVSVNPRLPLINIDPKLIREVYINLLSNAIKYTPEGGEISVFLSEKEDGVISQITDTGYGIPEKEQSKVFQKFYRGSNIIPVVTEGNGLGLYLVKAIVESSGGQIWFKSKEGKGTTFWFSLPKKGSKPHKGSVSWNS